METEAAAAKLRREANDRYFARVRREVEAVVGKLEGVSSALKNVERESRNVWATTTTTTAQPLNESSRARGDQGAGFDSTEEMEEIVSDAGRLQMDAETEAQRKKSKARA
jgi:hypothetical protein